MENIKEETDIFIFCFAIVTDAVQMRSQRGTQQKLREHLKDNCEGAGRNNKRLTLNPHGSHNGHREKLISALVRRANEHGGQMDDLGGRVTERCAILSMTQPGLLGEWLSLTGSSPLEEREPFGKVMASVGWL